MREIVVKVHEVKTDGLPAPADTDRVALLFDGCVVSGWPIGEQMWEGDADVSHGQPFTGVTHWLEFPEPLHTIERGQ